MDYKKKKLKFPKGVKTIKFPMKLPYGDLNLNFNVMALYSIESIKMNYEDRKDVEWDFTVHYLSGVGEVIVFKIK